MTTDTPQPGPAWTPEPAHDQHPAPQPSAYPYAGYDQNGYVPNGYVPHGGAAYGYPGYGYGYPPPAAPKQRRRGKRTLVSVGAAALAAGLVVSGVAIGHATESSGSLSSALGGSSSSTGGSSSTGSGSTSGGTGQGYTPSQGSGSTSTSGTTATSTQQAGIVTIVSVLKYENAESAGTGMVLTSDGEILTNNHVISGATSVTVTVNSTGKSYKATVVGTDATDDVAVLKLANASGLTKAKIGSASDVKDVSTGDTVTGVGNAGGTGTLTSATGKVTALNKTITASDESGASSETLDGLIETDAAIISGDSGGPLYDADGDIVGIDTAASTDSSAGSVNGASVASQAYAIPITDALSIAEQIESGVQTSSVRIGLPAFLGIGLTTGTDGATVGSVVTGGPADDAGIAAGATIGGTSVSSASTLQSAVATHEPGDKVSVSWTDASGQNHTATVTLGTGPAA